jgi:hypothetical protein
VARKDDVTMELPGVAKRQGRPVTGKAMTAAERMKAMRERKKADGLEQVAFFLSKDEADALRGYVKRRSADVEEMTLGDAVGRIVRDRLLRKR